MPIFGSVLLKNQSNVKPFQGSAGNIESLKANMPAAKSGAAR